MARVGFDLRNKMMENKEFFIDCDGSRIHAKLDFPLQEKDKYPLLIVLHGFTGHMEEEHILAAAGTAVEEGYASLRVELFGHGLSDGDFKDHTILLWMHQAMRVIEYARNLDFVSEILLTGHSQGGLTSVLAAGIMSDRIKALIPLSPAMNLKYAVMEGDMLGQLFDLNDLPESMHIREDFYITGNYLRAAMILPVEECVRQFDRTGKPVLIIHGTADETVPYEYGEKLAKQYKTAKLVPIEGDDHCYHTHLDQVTEALRLFLRQIK